MKKILIITILAHLTTTANATPATDLDLCVWSYEGIIEYQTALTGCMSGKLDGLSTEQQVSIDIMTPEQFNEIQTVIEYQAQTGCDWDNCIEAIFG